VDPSELLTELVAGSFGGTHVQLDLDPPGTWLPVDPVRIRLLARNLLTNALRHTPPGGTPPVLSSHIDADRCGLAVRNEGPDVAADQLSGLTAPCYRPDSSRQRESGGVGLGLYLSRAIAEAHGATLTIESAPGQGTRVIVSIPAPSNG
jgi:signal transduction histidine kinase